MLPEMVRSAVDGKINVPLIIKLTTVTGVTSKVTVTPDGIVTLEEDVGAPPHQLPDELQLPEVPPIQVPVALTVNVPLVE